MMATGGWAAAARHDWCCPKAATRFRNTVRTRPPAAARTARSAAASCGAIAAWSQSFHFLQVEAQIHRRGEQRERPPLHRVGVVSIRRDAGWTPVAKIPGTGIRIQKEYGREQR